VNTQPFAHLNRLKTALTAMRASASAAAYDVVSGSRSEDPLAGRDPDFIRTTLETNERVAALYFRPEVRGLEHIPAEGPVLLVGNHSGGTLIADTFVFAFAFYRHFGAGRRFYQLAHDLAVRLPAVSALLRKYGTVSASHENARHALDAGAAVLVYPGGDNDSYRPTWHSGQVEFGGRSGFIRLAIAENVPIVPVVAIGGQETALFLTRGRRLASMLQLDRLFRLKVLPIQFAPPFGFTVLDLPLRLPMPSQITVQVLPRLDLHERFGPEPHEQEVYDELTRRMQQGLDQLTKQRDLPVIGDLDRGMGDGTRRGWGGAGAELDDGEPWQGYDELTVREVVARLPSHGDEVVDAVRSYEQGRKGRKGVMSAAERERARRRRVISTGGVGAHGQRR
jgi:1-acyl-sn-glycerol-3-phosphate acyltransferase